MPPESIKEYFRFTRKERIAIICLVIVIMVIAWLPRFLNTKSTLDPGLISQSREEQKKLEQVGAIEEENSKEESTKGHNYPTRTFSSESPGKLFSFDPNTLDEKGWKDLGLKEKTITTIKKYLSKGGSFKSASDIHKIYGISERLADQLEPYVKIVSSNYIDKYKNASPLKEPYKEYQSKTLAMVDVNNSDTADWIALPGIGPTLARRIVLFREKLGGFYTVEQVAETYGLADSVYARIKKTLVIKDMSVLKININTADANRLKQHPYFGWKLANALVKYRESNGLFKDCRELSQIDLFAPEILAKLLPYLSVE